MPLDHTLDEFRTNVTQCDALIANAHRMDGVGSWILPLLDRKQITVAAFLNLYVAWEAFLEAVLAELMTGSATLSGTFPIRYVSPVNVEAARALVIGVNRYFDYGNHEYVRRLVRMYFQDGYPFEPHMSSISSDLSDLRTMRNASAHITSTTQAALESLALRILSRPSAKIDLYSLLTRNDPRSTTGETVFLTYKTKLVVAAELISRG